MKQTMKLWLLVLSLSIINHHVLAADKYSTVNPFSKDALLAINWNKFPSGGKLKRFDAYTEAKEEKGDWLFLYQRKFSNEFGAINEVIQGSRHGSKNAFRYLINGAVSDKTLYRCKKVIAKLKKTLGVANVTIDKSRTAKVKLSDTSDATMDWHTLNTRDQWQVGKSVVTASCLGFKGTADEAQLEAIFMLAIESENTAKMLMPVQWIKCKNHSTTAFSDGTQGTPKDFEWVLGIDFNDGKILRQDNSYLNNDPTIEEEVIKFDLGDEKSPFPVSINRATGTLTSDRKKSNGNIWAKMSINGSCDKFDKNKKKF